MTASAAHLLALVWLHPTSTELFSECYWHLKDNIRNMRTQESNNKVIPYKAEVFWLFWLQVCFIHADWKSICWNGLLAKERVNEIYGKKRMFLSHVQKLVDFTVFLMLSLKIISKFVYQALILNKSKMKFGLIQRCNDNTTVETAYWIHLKCSYWWLALVYHLFSSPRKS